LWNVKKKGKGERSPLCLTKRRRGEGGEIACNPRKFGEEKKKKEKRGAFPQTTLLRTLRKEKGKLSPNTPGGKRIVSCEKKERGRGEKRKRAVPCILIKGCAF